MISVDEACQKIRDAAGVLPSLDVDLNACTGLVLADDAFVSCDSPPFDKAMMDGFAVSSSATSEKAGQASAKNGRVRLRVVETITAGTVPSRVIDHVTAARIMTGAPMPKGADCVVPIERVSVAENVDDEVVISTADLTCEKHVLRSGAIAVVGEALLSAGTRLQAQHVAALAEFGMAKVPCVPCPRVAVLATGDELLDVAEPLSPGRIRNSNEPMLLSQVARAGCKGTGLGIAADEIEALEAKIRSGLSHDVLLLSGGVSAGMLDLVPQVFQKLGVIEIFHKIAMKPGKPLWFGRFERDGHSCLVFGLPGNPVSSMVCFEVFVRPALRKLAGRSAEQRCRMATLEQEAVVKGDRVTYFPATFRQTQDGLMATALPWAGSADLRTTAAATGLLILEPEQSQYSPGDQVPCLLW